jgi:hypothetical protein
MTTPADPTPAESSSAPPPPRKKRGVLKWIVLTVLIVLIVGGVIVFSRLNEIVRSVVEKQSAASLNVPTKLEAANVSLLGGNVGLRNFQVGQPSGFVAPQLMSLGGVDVDASIGELRQDPVRVKHIAIRDPKLVIEMKGMDFNIKKFIDQLPAGEAKPADESEPLKLIINDLQVRGATVVFRPDVAAVSALPGVGDALKGVKQEYTLTIPDLAMQNIGTGEGNQNGAQIKEVVTLLVTQLADKARQSDQLPPELRQILSLNVNDLKDLAKQKVGAEINKRLDKVSEDIQKKLPGETGAAVGEILKDPGAAAKDPGKAIEQGLGGLLGGKKKSQPASAPATPATQPK